MKPVIFLPFASSTLAVPFGNDIDAMFGTSLEARHDSIPPPGEYSRKPSYIPSGTGTGIRFPSIDVFPTATGSYPTASGKPHPSYSNQKSSTILSIKYPVGPTLVPDPKPKDNEPGQHTSKNLDGMPVFTPPGYPASPVSSALPENSFRSNSPDFPDSPPHPSSTPCESNKPWPSGNPFPSGGFPYLTGGYPWPNSGNPYPTVGQPYGTGIAGHPTTLSTLTRSPSPPKQTDYSEYDDEQDEAGEHGIWSYVKESLGY